ncbi:cilia- and flagella-associated protein 157 [Latimeria chalumnae]|uniref:Cilia- and flagella-associated protein 157 n=1 Tax=Latimeria chalumnae TaxID=7897 RepID=H3BAX1_LATCH|nr:PREDICTED: uncharacterized protein C9orf117 homolog [Latimeria chalumnae]|eukprot:XP_005992170.1 PREDICTED: uncharacterized protein C9orf117 homolog [Latimeria chalumnae]
MPKGKEKKKKKGKGSAKEPPPPPAPPEPLSELSKEFYLIQIRDLEDRLIRYQRKCDELSLGSTELESQFKKLAQDKKEIVDFLKRSLDQSMEEVANLHDQLIGLQQAKDSEKENYEAQLTQLRHELQDTKDQLTSENMILAGKLASLEQFRVQKEDLMAQFAALEEQLKREAEEHKDVLYNLERKSVIDKDRLKKEMFERVNVVAAEFRRVSNKQMADTTKRAIRENVAITIQMAKMSEKSMELIRQNDELREKELTQRQQVEMLEYNEKAMTRKNISNQKVIGLLTAKCQEQQDLLEEYIRRNQDFMKMEMDFENLQEEHDITKQRLLLLEEELKNKNEDVERMKAQVMEEREIRRKVEKFLSDAAFTLRDALLEKPRKGEEEFDILLHVRRNQMLQKLLALLDGAATLGLGPHVADFIPEPELMVEHQSQLKPDRTTSFASLLKSPGLVPHYKLGDLGLVPRPNQLIHKPLDKLHMLSRTTRLGVLKPGPRASVNSMTEASLDKTLNQGKQSSAFPEIPTEHVSQETVLKVE